MIKAIKVQIPSTPNFLRYDGFPDIAIPFSEFSEKELRQIGKEWTRLLIEKAKQKKI